MIDVSEVIEDIYLMRLETSGRFGSSLVYFIADGETALVETGPTVVVPSIMDGIHRLGHDPASLSYIFLTHIHLDHAGGVGTLAQEFPQLQVVVSQRGARHLIDPTRLIEGTRQAFGDNFEEEYGPILPVSEQQVHVAQEGETIILGDREIKVYNTPGHAPHHICIYDTKSRGLFSGEALSSPQPGPNPAMPVVGFNPDAALETIDKLRQLNPQIVFSSHGGVVPEPAPLMQSVRETITAYGDIILEGMRAGETVEQISRRLKAYDTAKTAGRYPLRERRYQGVIRGYMTYYRRKGIV